MFALHGNPPTHWVRACRILTNMNFNKREISQTLILTIVNFLVITMHHVWCACYYNAPRMVRQLLQCTTYGATATIMHHMWCACFFLLRIRSNVKYCHTTHTSRAESASLSLAISASFKRPSMVNLFTKICRHPIWSGIDGPDIPLVWASISSRRS